MKTLIYGILLMALLMQACGNSPSNQRKAAINLQPKMESTVTDTSANSQTILCPGCEAKGETSTLTCNLMSPELRKRKETVLALLKKQIISKKELPNGYAFRFKGSDAVIDELTEFVKTERQCCSFFTFNLSFGKENGDAWLELKGPEGAKDFITEELGL